jgi:hypothetical protein
MYFEKFQYLTQLLQTSSESVTSTVGESEASAVSESVTSAEGERLNLF